MWISQCNRNELSALWNDDKFRLVCARSMASLVSGESCWLDAGDIVVGFVSVVPRSGLSRSLDWDSVAGIVFCL